jgi:hypothetical protein
MLEYLELASLDKNAQDVLGGLLLAAVAPTAENLLL